jgi:hypothetical protein
LHLLTNVSPVSHPPSLCGERRKFLNEIESKIENELRKRKN